MVDFWKVAALGEAVAAVSYGYLALLIGRNLVRSAQWRHNTLGLATLAFFVAGAGSRLLYAVHVMPVPWDSGAIMFAARERMADPLHVAASITAATVAAWFFGQRAVLRPVHSVWLWDELRQRRLDAARIQRDVVVRLRAARDHLAHEDRNKARDEVGQALDSAREIISETLRPTHRVRPGALRIGRSP